MGAMDFWDTLPLIKRAHIATVISYSFKSAFGVALKLKEQKDSWRKCLITSKLTLHQNYIEFYIKMIVKVFNFLK